jgi:serine protease inhibitor
MRRFLLVIVLMFVVAVSGCSAPSVSMMEKPAQSVLDSFRKEMANGHNQFGFNVYKALPESNQNVMVSPLSLSMCFAMALMGTDGTRKQNWRPSWD